MAQAQTFVLSADESIDVFLPAASDAVLIFSDLSTVNQLSNSFLSGSIGLNTTQIGVNPKSYKIGPAAHNKRYGPFGKDTVVQIGVGNYDTNIQAGWTYSNSPVVYQRNCSQYPKIIGASGVTAILPSSGTFNADGSFTLTTALPYQPGSANLPVLMYIPSGIVLSATNAAGTVLTGDGWYWVTFTSTTTGQLYLASSTSGYFPGSVFGYNNILCTAGAYTQLTAADIPLLKSWLAPSITNPSPFTGNKIVPLGIVAAGSMGSNGSLKINTSVSVPNNINSKLIKHVFGDGGALIGNIGNYNINGASTSYFDIESIVKAKDFYSKQFATQHWAGASTINTGGSIQTKTTWDTSQDSYYDIVLNLGVATDYIMIEHLSAELLPSN